MITDTTASTDFADLTSNLMVQLPGCPTILIENALRRAAAQFYKETWAWLQYLPEFTVAADAELQLMTPPAGAAIVGIQHLESSADMPGYVFAPPRSLIFDRPPREGSTVKPLVALTLTHGASGVPDGHASLWLTTWEAGALWNLRQQKGQPWYDLNDAEYQRTQFRSGIVEERARIQSGGIAGGLAVRYRPFI